MYETYKTIANVILPLIGSGCILVSLVCRKRGDRMQGVEYMQLAILAFVLQANL